MIPGVKAYVLLVVRISMASKRGIPTGAGKADTSSTNPFAGLRNQPILEEISKFQDSYRSINVCNSDGLRANTDVPR